MLLSLTVKNFAIIDNISIDFSNGMTVLTGETGAGKSLIIDAIGLLFGDRASADLVRYDEVKATIEGVFSDYSNNIKDILIEAGIDAEDILVIKREIYQNGKSLAKVNGETVNLNVLMDLSNELGDIHTQFDAVKLVNPKNYFSFIDSDEINELLVSYKQNLKEYRKYNNLYLEKKEEENQNNQKLEFLKYQINELSKAKLQANEEETLRNEIKMMDNYEKLSTNYHEVISLFDDNKLTNNLYEAINLLKKNSEYDESLKEKIERLESSYYEITDIYDDINNIIRNLDFNPDDFDRKNERLAVYSSLKRKYKMTTTELIEYLDKIRTDVDNIENYDVYLADLLKEVNKYYELTYKIGKEISLKRQAISKELTNNLVKIFPDLQLKNTTFEIKLSNDEANPFKPNGIDNIDFLISFNKGEPLKPLSKVASGGELSRFMLAIKAISCNKETKKTFIFDEIDSGVSGEVAGAIALKINEIAKNNQVICVTHLPQVASIAKHHFNISKKVLDGARTVTEINLLSYEERINNIALMISKGNITEASIMLAKEFLNK